MTETTHTLFTFVKPENAKEFDVMLTGGADIGACLVKLCAELKCVPKVVSAIPLTRAQAKQLKEFT